MQQGFFKIKIFPRPFFNKNICYQTRNAKIYSFFFCQKFLVHSGNLFYLVVVNSPLMFNHKFGEFAPTTVSANYLDKKEKRKH